MTEIEKKLWQRVKRYKFIFRFVPFVRMVAVCNSLSFGRVDEESDIDLFVVVKSGRLFLVRILLVGVFQLLGVRRHGNKIARRFCLSFFVDDRALDLSEIALKGDVYLAYWVKNLMVIADDGISKEFFAVNSWIKDYFEDQENFVAKKVDFSVKLRASSLGVKILGGKFGDFLEKWLKRWQMGRAKNKAEKLPDNSGIVVSHHMLKFHNRDLRLKYRQRWLQIFGENTKITNERFLALKLDS